MSPAKKLEPLDIGTIARGAAIELFNLEIAKVAANIWDKNTPAEAKREVTLKFSFKPDLERRAIEVTTTATSKLAPINKHSSRAFVGRDDTGRAYILDSDPRQEMLFEPQAEEPDNVHQMKA